MPHRIIVVIGASAGGIAALRTLFAGLPSTFQAAILVVVHLSADGPSLLPAILDRGGPLPALQAEDGMVITPGHVYVAPTDRHLAVEQGRIRVTRGPKENRFRPAIDVLFRSAAYAYERQVIGVILSGMLDDGTAGLRSIKERGGVAIVQDPKEALFASMPRSALQHVAVDYCLQLAEMAPTLVSLTEETLEEKTLEEKALEEKIAIEKGGGAMSVLAIENQIAMEENPLQSGVMSLGPLSPFTCPECHGVLLQVQESSILRFRCHTGHAFSAESLLAALVDSIDKTLWDAVRVTEEGMLLLRHVAGHVRQQQDLTLASRFEEEANHMGKQVEKLQRLALSKED